MESGFGQSTSMPPQNSSCSSNIGNDTGDFECNICFDLPQDPIVTLCGHLFCWPCLYRWLHHHSQSQECPVCKALVREDKLVPLYGRGKSQTDPRSKSYPRFDIPNRPSAQRPDTTPPPMNNQFTNYGFGLMGGFSPTATAVGGLIPSLFNIQFHGFSDATVYGTTSGFPYPYYNAYYGGHAHGFSHPGNRRQQADSVLKNLVLLIGVFVVLALLCW